MKSKCFFIGICFLFLSCGHEPDLEPESSIGHLLVNVTFQEPVTSESGKLIGLSQYPGEGSVVRLYRKGAKCAGYKDAGFGIAWADNKPVTSIYDWTADSDGEALLGNIQSGEYYITIYTSKLTRYTEKNIVVPMVLVSIM